MTQPSILFALESFFPSHRAGTEVYVLNLCLYFRKKGWPVGVLISTTTNKSDYIYENIPVYTFLVPAKPLAKELNGLIPPRGIEGFIDRIKELKPDLVHFHSFGRAINGFHLQAVKELGIITAFTPHLGSFFCIKGDLLLNGTANCDGYINKKRCLACRLHSGGTNKGLNQLFATTINVFNTTKPIRNLCPASWFQADHRYKELQRVKQYADLVFSIAPWIQKAFELNGIKKAIRIPQGISPIFFYDSQLTFRITELRFAATHNAQRIHFAFIGRMHPSKGFHLLKQVWDTLENNNISLQIITGPSGGENDYFNAHKIWAKQKTNVTWQEGLTQAEVANNLSSIDVLILPSTSNEVAPLVIKEAASFGIPVIGSDYIAIKDMVQHGKNGLLFKNGDWEDLKTQMEELINHPERIEALRQNIQPPVTMDAVGEIIEQEYLKVLKDKW